MSPSPRKLRRFLVLAAAAITGCSPLTSRPPGPVASPDRFALPSGSGFHVLHPYLDQRIRVIEARSERFHAALDELRRGDLVVYVATPGLLAHLPLNQLLVSRNMRQRLGEFRVIPDEATGTVDTLLVVVDLERIAQLAHRPLLDSRSRFSARLDRLTDAILIHEIWGHLVPVATAGNSAATCADPAPGQPDLESCVMRRENDLRAELGWEIRRAYSFGR